MDTDDQSSWADPGSSDPNHDMSDDPQKGLAEGTQSFRAFRAFRVWYREASGRSGWGPERTEE